MTDFAIRFTDKPTFDAIHRYIFNSLAPSPLGEDEPVPFQHLTATGTHWFVDEIGVMYEQTGTIHHEGHWEERAVNHSEEGPEGAYDPNVEYENVWIEPWDEPVMTAREGWHVNLRWNGGDDPPPDNIPGMEVIWRSDAVDVDGDPVPRPEWWNRVIA